MSPPECYAMKTSSQPRISNRPPVATTQELQMTPETLQQDYMAVLQRDENHLRFLPKQHILPSTLPNWRPCPVCNCNLGMASGLVFGFLHRQDSLQGSTLVFLHPHVAKSRSSKKRTTSNHSRVSSRHPRLGVHVATPDRKVAVYYDITNGVAVATGMTRGKHIRHARIQR